MSSVDCTSAPRRSLFPTSYSKKKLRKTKFVSFSPYARCLKLESQHLSDEEISHIWWQKSEYDDFARVGKLISKAMLQGGSEIWLRSKSSSSSTIPSNGGANSKDSCEIRDKWWCKFGHSRRGLEHITSNAEGRQRYLNSRSVIRSVIEEQQRQRMFLPKGYAEIDKFRTVSLKETHWARVLAHAAGESDADAVKTNFDDNQRKTREYYLKKNFDDNNSSDYHIATNNDMLRLMPIFMKTADTSPKHHSTKKLNLDANTASQICFRKSQVISGKLLHDHKKSSSMTKEKMKSISNKLHREQPILGEEKKYQDDDDDSTALSTSSEDSSASLAKKAAGWGGDESSPEDMSTILIGMGISTEPRITVG